MPKKGYRKPDEKRAQTVSIEQRHLDMIDRELSRSQSTMQVHDFPVVHALSVLESPTPGLSVRRRKLIGQCIDAVLGEGQNLACMTVNVLARPFLYGTQKDRIKTLSRVRIWQLMQSRNLMETAPAPVMAGSLMCQAQKHIEAGEFTEAAKLEAQAYDMLEKWRQETVEFYDDIERQQAGGDND